MKIFNFERKCTRFEQKCMILQNENVKFEQKYPVCTKFYDLVPKNLKLNKLFNCELFKNVQSKPKTFHFGRRNV